MDELIKNSVKVRKKISLNVNVSLLRLVEDLAKLTKTNNTIVIESLLVKGIHPLFQSFKDSWTVMAIETKDNSKKEKLNKLLKDLQEISKKDEVRILTGELTINYKESLKKKKVIYE